MVGNEIVISTGDNMRKLKDYIEKWMVGQKVRGVDVSLYDIRECVRIYNEMLRMGKPEFINSKVKEILDKCNIKTIEYGIGWKIA